MNMIRKLIKYRSRDFFNGNTARVLDSNPSGISYRPQDIPNVTFNVYDGATHEVRVYKDGTVKMRQRDVDYGLHTVAVFDDQYDAIALALFLSDFMMGFDTSWY